MKHHQNWNAFRDSVPKFPMGKTQIVSGNGAVATAYDEDIVVTLIQQRGYEIKCILIGRWKAFHLDRKVTHFDYCVLYRSPFISQVFKG